MALDFQAIPALVGDTIARFFSVHRHRIYLKALEIQQKGSGFEPNVISTSIGRIAYLENKADINKPTLVLLHGLGADRNTWVSFAKLLKKEYRIIIIDLPGHGESVQLLEMQYDLASQVTHLEEIIDELGLKRFHIIGHSMGGAIAADYCSKHSDRIMSLGLFNPIGAYKAKSEFYKLLQQGKNLLIPKDKKAFVELLQFSMVKPPVIPLPAVGAVVAAVVARKDINQKVFNDFDQVNLSIEEKIKTITAPTLILWGEHDRLVHPLDAELFNELIRGSVRVMLPNVGHVPMVEDSNAAAEQYRQFIDSLA